MRVRTAGSIGGIGAGTAGGWLTFGAAFAGFANLWTLIVSGGADPFSGTSTVASPTNSGSAFKVANRDEESWKTFARRRYFPGSNCSVLNLPSGDLSFL